MLGMTLKDRIYFPADTKAVLWDLDGVLLDTLTLDLRVCNELLKEYFGENVSITKDFIRSIFAYHIEKFWELILEFVEEKYQTGSTKEKYSDILEKYNELRGKAVFLTNPGIKEILADAGKQGIKVAVVSNNAQADIEKFISQSGIADYFQFIVGNDIGDLKKKPAPDTYLHAVKKFNLSPENCVVVEDSLLGAEAGKRAGCFTIGVATGGTSFEDLEQSKWTDQVYSSFESNNLFLQLGKVTEKKINSPNEFLSHMVEHIAWRLGCRINLQWNNNDWYLLGKKTGEQISSFGLKNEVGIALGMIDDGSAEIIIEPSQEPDVEWGSPASVDLDWFFSLRCEQTFSGKPMQSLATGLAMGLQARISIMICSVEDPHHTWEGIYRGIGVALNRMYSLPFAAEILDNCHGNHDNDSCRDSENNNSNIKISQPSCSFCRVERKTAESSVIITLDFNETGSDFNFQISPIVKAKGLEKLLTEMAEYAGCSIKVDFSAQALSSSHVLVEDIAIVLGRALKEILIRRMLNHGVNGGGSSIQNKADIDEQAIRVGLSVEGRKFLHITSFKDSVDTVRREFLVGHTVCNDIFSEDLDDFLSGLCEGFSCSLVLHIKELISPDDGWQLVFKNLGKAIKEVFSLNINRQGVPAGVKGTLD
jgi:HAD superfamily hydrolase (TIGR01509 family)